MMALELELETYRKNLPQLLDRQGKFVLIYGEEVVGVFDTHEDALREGYERFGFATPFFVRQIQETEKPKFFSRNIRPCPM